jgi:hypothetical protein
MGESILLNKYEMVSSLVLNVKIGGGWDLSFHPITGHELRDGETTFSSGLEMYSTGICLTRTICPVFKWHACFWKELLPILSNMCTGKQLNLY